MIARIRVLASPATASGFRLAGLAVDEVTAAADAGERLLQAAAQPDLGILLVEQSVLDAAPDAARRAVEKRVLPILVPIPTPAWDRPPVDAESYILDLLRRSIGYRVRLP